MTKSIKEVALDLLYSEANNGYGIQVDAIKKACETYGFNFKELFGEIMNQAEIKE